MLRRLPIRGRRSDGPEFRRGLAELNSPGGKPRIRRPEKSDGAFVLVFTFQIRQFEGLADLDFRREHDERTVRADGYGESFLFEFLRAVCFSFNEERNIEQDSFATPRAMHG